jgi:hypothetical protein
MRGEGRREEATLLIQATYRMYRWSRLLPEAVYPTVQAASAMGEAAARRGGAPAAEPEGAAGRRPGGGAERGGRAGGGGGQEGEAGEEVQADTAPPAKQGQLQRGLVSGPPGRVWCGSADRLPMQVRGFLQHEREAAAGRVQAWWRGHWPGAGGRGEAGAGEGAARQRAAATIQAWFRWVGEVQLGRSLDTRRWLEARQSSPAWSHLLQPRVISEKRARELRREVEAWQARTPAAMLDRGPDLHSR